MKYPAGRSAASAMIAAAMSMRMFWGMTVDYPVAQNAAWLCPLLGFVLCLPLVFAIAQASKSDLQSPWLNLAAELHPILFKPLEALFALLLLFDAAVVTRLTASSSNIIALGNATVHLLIVPLGLSIIVLVILGANAGGNSARVALHALPLFLLILLAVQLKSYRVYWLAPLLGEDPIRIFFGGVYCAGNIALMLLIWITAQPDLRRHGIFSVLLISCAAVSLLLACFQMSFPVMPNANFTQAARIELILSNGRMSLSPQFVLNVLWYGGQLYLLSADVLGAASYLVRLFPACPLWLLACIEALAVSVAAILDPPWLSASWRVTLLFYPLIGGVFAWIMLLHFIRKRGKIACPVDS